MSETEKKRRKKEEGDACTKRDGGADSILIALTSFSENLSSG